MKIKTCLKKAVFAAVLVLVLTAAGCGILQSGSQGTQPDGNGGQSEDSGKSAIHFPEVNKKEWVTSVSKLCVNVNQSYSGLGGIDEPIAEEIAAILGRIGVETVIGDSPDCQATLNIALEMTPVGEDVIGAGTCYFSASAKGQAVLSASGQKDLALELSRTVSTGGSGFSFVYSCPSQQEANYEAAWGIAIMPMFAEWWGAPALVSALRSDNYALNNQAVNRLAGMGAEGSGAIPTLIEMLKDVDPTARSSAARALGQFGPAAKGAVPDLIALVNDADYGVSSAAIAALGEIGDAQAMPVLIQLLNEGNEPTRAAAAEAIGKMGPAAAAAVPDLAKAINDKDYNVSWNALSALDGIGPDAKEAVPALIARLESGEKSLDYMVVNALESITGQEYGEDAAAWRRWYEANQE